MARWGGDVLYRMSLFVIPPNLLLALTDSYLYLSISYIVVIGYILFIFILKYPKKQTLRQIDTKLDNR